MMVFMNFMKLSNMNMIDYLVFLVYIFIEMVLVDYDYNIVFV